MVEVEQLQRLISHETAFTKAYGFVVKAAGEGSCTLEVPHLPHFERPGGVASGQVCVTRADGAWGLPRTPLRGLDGPWVTTNRQRDFPRGGRGEPFTCTAKVLKL